MTAHCHLPLLVAVMKPPSKTKKRPVCTRSLLFLGLLIQLGVLFSFAAPASSLFKQLISQNPSLSGKAAAVKSFTCG